MISSGAVPVLARGSEQMAPTLFRWLPGINHSDGFGGSALLSFDFMILVQNKQQLRDKMRALRAQLSLAEREKAAQAAAKHFLNLLPDFRGIIALYMAKGSELSCEPLAILLRQKGARLALPVVGAGKILDFKFWQDDCSLVEGAYGILQPAPNAKSVTPDVVAVPLLAFDAKGNRLGQGGGYYDATLVSLRSCSPDVLCVGFGFSVQECADVFAEPHDMRLDFIVTEAGVKRF